MILKRYLTALIVSLAVLPACTDSKTELTTTSTVVVAAKPRTTVVIRPLPTTTTTIVDLSGVDWTAFARSVHGPCGEFHDMALSVGWTEDEWPILSTVMWRESRCTVDAWNGADAGLTQVNQIHSKWLNEMGMQHPESMFDPVLNLTFARKLWEGSGWKPWRATVPGTEIVGVD